MLTWEEVKNSRNDKMYRAKVPGGWFVKNVESVAHVSEDAARYGYGLIS